VHAIVLRDGGRAEESDRQNARARETKCADHVDAPVQPGLPILLTQFLPLSRLLIRRGFPQISTYFRLIKGRQIRRLVRFAKNSKRSNPRDSHTVPCLRECSVTLPLPWTDGGLARAESAPCLTRCALLVVASSNPTEALTLAETALAIQRWCHGG
jgi:hypothetical protein